jgi:hypothetical protein
MTYRGGDTLSENIIAIMEPTRNYQRYYTATGELPDFSADDN